MKKKRFIQLNNSLLAEDIPLYYSSETKVQWFYLEHKGEIKEEDGALF